MLKSFQVLKNERGALLKDGDFVRLLSAGKHYVFDPLDVYSITKWKIDAPMNDVDLVNYLARYEPATAEEAFVDMIMRDDEVGLRYEDDLLVEIIAPGSRRIFWKGLVKQRLERIDIGTTYEVEPDLARRYLNGVARLRPIEGIENVLFVRVPAYQRGVLRVDGTVVRLMAPGLAAFWKFNREILVELVDLRLQTLEVSGQEILSSDKVGLRLNLVAMWRFTDVLGAFEKLPKPADHLYRELQLGLRAAVGMRSIDELLENKQAIDEVMSAYAARKLNGFGIEVTSVGVKDIVLPGDMKTILAKVVEAQKLAEANVIRRREETAATRSLLNTAKVMEGNPVALRLKELETLERVAERIDRISVFGGLDQVLNGLVSIKST